MAGFYLKLDHDRGSNCIFGVSPNLIEYRLAIEILFSKFLFKHGIRQ